MVRIVVADATSVQSSHVHAIGGSVKGLLRLVVLVAATLGTIGAPGATNAQSLAPRDGRSHGLAPADPMLVVDVEALSVDEQLTFAALQGIVNRTTPSLYLVGLRSAQDFDVDPSAEDWLADAVDVPYERVTPTEALTRLAGRAKGIVVWDPAVPHESQNVATTIAGRDDLLPASPEIAQRLHDDVGLSIEVDLRDLGLTTDTAFTEWALAELAPPPGGWGFPVWMGRPRNGKAVQPGLRDWAVANRAFVFDLDPATSPTLLSRVLDRFPRGTGVYGYVFFDTPVYAATGIPVNEALGVGELTTHGDWLIPTTDATNTTVHVLSTQVPRKAPWDDAPRTPDPTKTYVSFVVSDGDALGYDMTLARSLQFDHLGSSSLPIGISTSPLLATHAPAIWNWYLDHLPANANLVAGPSGSGYAFPSYASAADRDRYLAHSRADLDATGLRSTWAINPPLTPTPSSADVAELVDGLAPSSLYLDYTPGAPRSPTVSFTDGVPVTRVAMATKPSDIAQAIRASQGLQADGPRFVSIGLVTWGVDADDAAAELAKLGDDVVAVAPDEYAGLLRGAAGAGYPGSSDQVEPVAPAKGACRADVDQITWGTTPVVAAFLADATFGGDLPAAAVAHGSPGTWELTVDDGRLTQQLERTLGALGRLAFSAEAIDGAEVQVSVTDLAATGPPTDGAVPAEGRYRFTISYDPGDGPRSASLSVPVACAAVVSADAEQAPPAAPQPGTPAYTG